MARSLYVSVAILFNEQGEVLVAQRPQGMDHAGLWEFPGGKLAPYETGLQALKREVSEELGVRVETARPMMRIRHRYPDKKVYLDVWKVLSYTGQPWGREGQLIEWQPVSALSQLSFLEANAPVIKALQLPDQLLITGHFADRAEAVKRLKQALDKGIRWVQLRAPQLSPSDYSQLAEAFLPLCRQAGAILQLNTDLALAQNLSADALHLNSQQLLACHQRPVSPQQWLSASCHNADELDHAREIGVDFVLLSPVLPTTSHPDRQPLFWQGFSQLVEQHGNLPIFALGGMRPDDRDRVFALGGQGVAGISHFW